MESSGLVSRGGFGSVADSQSCSYLDTQLFRRPIAPWSSFMEQSSGAMIVLKRLRFRLPVVGWQRPRSLRYASRGSKRLWMTMS